MDGQRAEYYDYNLIAVILLLVGFGLVMLYSTSAYIAQSWTRLKRLSSSSSSSYNPECKFTLQQITPTTYVSPLHAFSAVTIKIQ